MHGIQKKLKSMKKESTKHQIAYYTSSVDLNRSGYPSTLDAAILLTFISNAAWRKEKNDRTK